MARNIDTCILDGLDIDFSRYFSSRAFTFASKLKTVSLDSHYFYRRTTPIDFKPMVDKMRQDEVKEIGFLKLPSERVRVNKKIDEGNKGYLSILGPILGFCTVRDIHCAFIRDDDEDVLLNVLSLVSEKSRTNVTVAIPKMNPFSTINITSALSKSKYGITLQVNKNSIKKIEVASKNARIVPIQDEVKFDTVPTNAVNIFASGGRYQERSVSLFFDSVPSYNLHWQDHAYKHIRMTKTWKRLDEFSEHRSSVDMRKGILSPNEEPVTIAVLDTGILSSHTAFMSADDGPKGYGRTIKVKNFVPPSYGSYENDEWLDRNGHGTHCASIAAGGTFRAWIPENKQEGALPSLECGDIECGVAPFARLVVGKIATTGGYSKPEWMAEALDWIVNLERDDNIKVDIISLSVGYAKFSKRLFDSVCRALLAGKVIVCASSNDGRRQQTNISFPARFGNVLCVGSHSKKGQPSEFSPNGREIDVLGPGEDIWAALSANEHGAVFPFSGTSAATPFVAGVCALVLVAAQRIGGETLRSRVSNTSMMREILRKMATKPGHHDESMGYGNVDPWNVFNYGKGYFTKIIDDVLELDDNSAPTRVKQLPE